MGVFIQSVSLTLAGIAAIAILTWIVTTIVGNYNRKEFFETYNIKIGNNIKKYTVQHVYGKQENCVIYRWPHWLYANKDGTQNLVRQSNNCLIWPKSELHIDNWLVETTNPLYIFILAEGIRKTNPQISIPYAKEELEQLEKKKKDKHMEAGKKGIQSIIYKYEENPTEFEEFVASVYEKLGYKTKVTPKTNDGGYDILMTKRDKSYLVECKCFNLFNKVSRPLIQKLVGANHTEGADELIFVTTSSFSKEAEEYARKTGVTTISGVEFMELVNKADKKKSKSPNVELKINDFLGYIPKDMTLSVNGEVITEESEEINLI